MVKLARSHLQSQMPTMKSEHKVKTSAVVEGAPNSPCKIQIRLFSLLLNLKHSQQPPEL
jgi:hypothetical protein